MALFSERVNFIAEALNTYGSEGKRMFISSSFQTHSIPMLHIISRVKPDIPVYFLNTGYHFPETVAFKDEVAKLLGIAVKDARSSIPKSQQRDQNGQLYFTSDPDYCCFLNKTQPMDNLLSQYDVWINGVRGDQNANRKNLKFEEKTPNGKIRFHPMLPWTKQDVFRYIKEHGLPRHPLDEKGYVSVGCEPCTRKPDPMAIGFDERDGRWFGMNKTECGLHTDLVTK